MNENYYRGIPVGLLLLAAAGVVILVFMDMDWSHWFFNSMGSMMGAVVLIAAGVALWFWEMRGGYHKND